MDRPLGERDGDVDRRRSESCGKSGCAVGTACLAGVRPHGEPADRRLRRAADGRIPDSDLAGRADLALGRRFLADDLRPALSRLAGAAGATCAQIALVAGTAGRSEEHTSELQSLMRISYAVFCL